LGMMWARRCDSAARVVLLFRLTATWVFHFLTNSESVRPARAGNFFAASFTSFRCDWNCFHAARLDCSVTSPRGCQRWSRLKVPLACRTSTRYTLYDLLDFSTRLPF